MDQAYGHKMATTSVAKPTTKCTESENDSDVETRSAAGTSHANVKKDEDDPSSELADNNKIKESVIDDRTLLNKKIVLKKSMVNLIKEKVALINILTLNW